MALVAIRSAAGAGAGRGTSQELAVKAEMPYRRDKREENGTLPNSGCEKTLSGGGIDGLRSYAGW